MKALHSDRFVFNHGIHMLYCNSHGFVYANDQTGEARSWYRHQEDEALQFYLSRINDALLETKYGEASATSSATSSSPH